MNTNTTDKTHYSDSELQEFDALIVNKLEQAREQLKFYVDQISDAGQSSDSKNKGIEDSASSVESERLNTLAARQKKLIQHLENARRRIQNKVYGICRDTGKLICKDRLMAVPHATLSIAAKENQKRKK